MLIADFAPLDLGRILLEAGFYKHAAPPEPETFGSCETSWDVVRGSVDFRVQSFSFAR